MRLVGDHATKSQIETHLEDVIHSLEESDILYIFFAGHGFSHNARNYITCRDTNKDNLARTSIQVDAFFDWFKSSWGKRLVVFLDCCESGILADSSYRSIFSNLTERELNDFFTESEHRFCFAACKPGQKSYHSDALKHGIWSYHLIQALRGDTAALHDGLLTSNSLQNYLKVKVPETVRTHLTGTKFQTPWAYGSLDGEFLVADLRPILEAKKVELPPSVQQLASVELLGSDSDSVRSLSGFKKSTHTVPTEVNEYTIAFVIRISESEFEEKLKSYAAKVKQAYRFARKDLKITEGDGGATISCPYFDLSISRSLNEDKPSELLTEIRVHNIREPNRLLEQEFETIFDKQFDTIEMSVSNRVNVTDLIDKIEEIDNPSLTVEYNDLDLSYCTVNVADSDGHFEVSRSLIRFVHKAWPSPKALVQALFSAHQEIARIDANRSIVPMMGMTMKPDSPRSLKSAGTEVGTPPSGSNPKIVQKASGTSAQKAKPPL